VKRAISLVMAGLVPAISVSDALSWTEIPGTRPGMTVILAIAGQTLKTRSLFEE
jgi:hypothetical protein